MDLESVRQRWEAERPLYERFISHLNATLKEGLKGTGIWVRLSGRAKEMDSLLKKLIRKPEKTYEALTDKAGLRVVVRYREDIATVSALIEKLFHKLKKEDKSTNLAFDQFGYQGVHYDVELLPDDTAATEFNSLCAEIQVRTLSQDLWSEMAHELGYKPDFPIPSELSRRLHCLSAVVEVADMEFSRINNDYEHLPGANSHRVLSLLEKQFYKFVAVRYDKKLSLEVIRVLASLYAPDVLEKQKTHFEEFCAEKNSKLSFIFREYLEVKDRYLFMFQPEILMIFDRLEADKFSLAEQWAQYFPLDELQKLATAWGTPIET